MKKILALALVFGSSIMFAPAAQAKSAESNSTALTLEANASPQVVRQRTRTTQRINRRGARIVTRTRTTRVGGRVYREVVEYRYRPNGSVTTRVVSRTRVR
ncbi:MAG TPA: hypothetical protein VIL74_01965 [Pyrinomonadaceae bacterium]|jgi:hypothetical protein